MAVAMQSILSLVVRTSGADGIQKLQKEVNGLGRGVKAAEVGFKGFSGAVVGLSGVMAALTPLFSIAGIVSLGNKAIEAGDKFFDLSQKTGVSVEALAKFSKAAQLNGTDVDGVAKALQKLSKGMLEASTTGKGPAAGALYALGISATDASGRLRGADDVMLQVADRFKQIPDGATKTALAIQLFGKAGADMIPMLNQGSEAIGKLSVKMSADFAAKADEYSDKLTMIGGTVNSLGLAIAEQLLPSLIAGSDQILGLVKEVANWVNQNKSGIAQTARLITAFMMATGDAFSFVLKNIAAYSQALGHLFAGDFGGAVQVVKDRLGTMLTEAKNDFANLDKTINGTGQELTKTGTVGSAALDTITQRMKGMADEQEQAKQKQAQWKAWVAQTEVAYQQLLFTLQQAAEISAGEMKVMDARVAAETAVNNAAKTGLEIKLRTATTDKDKLTLTRQIAAIDIANAELQLKLSDAREAAALKEIQLKVEGAKAEQAKFEAEVARANVMGIVNDQLQVQVEKQKQVVDHLLNELAIQEALIPLKHEAAQATYDQAVAQANASVAALQHRIQEDATAAAAKEAANNIRQMSPVLDSAASAAGSLANSMSDAADSAGKMMAVTYRNPVFRNVFGQNFGALGMASGGYVTGPTAAVIGEGGEPEYVIPASKMAGAASSYLSGARGGAVLQGGGGGGDVQISITTGPTMQANGEQWVTVRDLERAMRTTADGVLNRVRTPAARRVLGIR